MVNVYSYREPGLIQPLLDQFTEDRHQTNVLCAGDGLLGARPGRGRAVAPTSSHRRYRQPRQRQDYGITQDAAGRALARVPDAYHDPDGQWVALSLRARVFLPLQLKGSPCPESRARPTRISPSPSGRAASAPAPGQHVYNIGLIATRIAHWGVDKTRDWLTAVRDNISTAPVRRPTASQVKNILDGRCDLAIGNTYYMGLMLNNEAEPEQEDLRPPPSIIYPDSPLARAPRSRLRRRHRQVRPQQGQRQKLVEFLLSDEAQHLYASIPTTEFPVVPGVPPRPICRQLGRAQGRPGAR